MFVQRPNPILVALCNLLCEQIKQVAFNWPFRLLKAGKDPSSHWYLHGVIKCYHHIWRCHDIFALARNCGSHAAVNLHKDLLLTLPNFHKWRSKVLNGGFYCLHLLPDIILTPAQNCDISNNHFFPPCPNNNEACNAAGKSDCLLTKTVITMRQVVWIWHWLRIWKEKGHMKEKLQP